MKPCTLPSLSDPRWRSPFVGLDFHEEGIDIDDRYFACCAGAGARLCDTGEVRMCLLQPRLDRLRGVLDLFLERWGREHWRCLQGMVETVDIDRLAACRAGNAESGRVKISVGRSVPSYLWLVAVAAVWRFFCHVHFVTLRMGSNGDILPPVLRPRTVVCVENFLSPWHPENALDCESIIDYCYDTRTPLWLDFMNEEQPAKKNLTTNARVVQLRRRIDTLKLRDPYLYLSQSGQAKLREMSVF